MKFDAIVLHNVSRDMFFGYKAKTSKLHHAHTFQVDADSVNTALDLIWVLTNVDLESLRLDYPHLSVYGEQVEHYRRRQNRSLSVGDAIVLMEGERFAGAGTVDMVGFGALLEPPKVDLSDLANQQEVSHARRAQLDWHAAHATSL